MSRLTWPSAVSFVLAAAGLTIGRTAAQTPTSFTVAQADAGRVAYDTHCSGCHLPDLQGSFEAPQLSGANFLNQWGDRTVAELHAYLMASMPPTNPGGPGAQAMTAIVAYILRANGARAGSQPLTPQASVNIRSTVATQATTRAAPAAADAAGQTTAASTYRKGLSVAGEVKKFVAVTDAMLRRPDPADWLMFRGNYQAWSYSALKEITAANVADLELAWVWAMAEGGTQQSHPLVHDGVLYLLNPHNILQALDAKTGTLIWEQRAGPSSGLDSADLAACRSLTTRFSSPAATRAWSPSMRAPDACSGKPASDSRRKATSRRADRSSSTEKCCRA